MHFVLTPWEVSQLFEELSLRPRVWFGRENLWVRRLNGENHIALKALNGLPDNMYALHLHVLDATPSDHASRYVEWLLRKLTTYGDRKEILRHLETHGVMRDIAAKLSKDLTHPDGLKVLAATPRIVSQASRSRHLQNLLRKERV